MSIPDRHRETDGQISKKHGDTLVSTLRIVYGQTFAAGHPDSVTLNDILHKINETSLSQLRRDHETQHLAKKLLKAG